MKNLPEGMIPNRDNQVYFDTEKGEFYIIRWTDGGNNDYAEKFYLSEFSMPHVKIIKKLHKKNDF